MGGRYTNCLRGKYTFWPQVYRHLAITVIGSCRTSHSKTKGINMELTSLSGYIIFHISGKTFHKILCLFVGIFFSLGKKAFVRSGTDVGPPGVQGTFQFIAKVFSRVEVRPLCYPLKFLHTRLVKPCLYGVGFVHLNSILWRGVLLHFAI